MLKHMLIALPIAVMSVGVLVKYQLFRANLAAELKAAKLIASFDEHEEDLEEILEPETFEPLSADPKLLCTLPEVPTTELKGVIVLTGSLDTRLNDLLGPQTRDSLPEYQRRLTKRRRTTPPKNQLSYALAHDAAFYFGSGRPKSEANLLITRKWMRDRLMEYKDLRKKDMCAIVDTALDLSFYASAEKRDMEIHCRTYAHQERSDTQPAGWWWWPFNKATATRRA